MPACLRCGKPTKEAKTKFCGTRCYHDQVSDDKRATFWDRVAKGPECWEWTGQKHYRGYGLVAIMRVKRYTHRVAWALVHGPIPPGMFVMHLCDNPPCVRPDHLRLGTPQENSEDMRAKGRARGNGVQVGQGRGVPKLNPDQVREIRRRMAEGEPRKVIAAAYGVSVATIKGIAAGRAWSRVA